MVDDRDPFLSPRGWTIDDDEDPSRASKGWANPFRAPTGWAEPGRAPTTAVGPDPAGVDDGRDCWAEGTLLVIQKGGRLPDRCVRCGGHAGGFRLRRSLSWHPPLLYLLFALNAALYALVVLFVRQTAMVMVPLCEEHRRRRRRAIAIGWLGVLGGIAVVIASDALPGGGLVLVGLGIAAVSLLHALRAWPVVWARRIDGNAAWIKGASPRFLAGLPAIGGWRR